jgi:hypothetical protein
MNRTLGLGDNKCQKADKSILFQIDLDSYEEKQQTEVLGIYFQL